MNSIPGSMSGVSNGIHGQERLVDTLQGTSYESSLSAWGIMLWGKHDEQANRPTGQLLVVRLRQSSPPTGVKATHTLLNCSQSLTNCGIKKFNNFPLTKELSNYPTNANVWEASVALQPLLYRNSLGYILQI